MKPSDKQRLKGEKLKQNMEKESKAWATLVEEKTYRTGPNGQIIDQEEYDKQTKDISDALTVLALSKQPDEKARRHERRKRKKAETREERKARRKKGREKAQRYVDGKNKH